MSYNQQKTVIDDEDVQQANDPEGEVATPGSLIFGSTATDKRHTKARAVKVSDSGELFVESIEMKQLLTDILKELKKQNTMLSMVVDAEITDLDLGDE